MYQKPKIIQLKKCIIVNRDDDIEYDFKLKKCYEIIKSNNLYNSGIFNSVDSIENYNFEYIIIYDFTSLGNIMDIMKFQSILKSKKIGIFSFLDSTRISRNWTSNEKFKFNLVCHLTEFLKHYDLNKALNELKYLDRENEPNEIEFMMKSLLENRYKRLVEIFNAK
jgi:hypothetical protein